MQSILNHKQTLETGYSGSKASPLAIGATIAVHMAIGGLVWMLPPGTMQKVVPPIIWVHFVKAPPPPKATPEQQDKKEQPLQRREETKQETLVDTKTLTDTDTHTTDEVLGNGGGNGGVGTGSGGATTLQQPVLVSAVPDPSRLRDFQPAYPPAMIRAQMEGYATVRVWISASGRVEQVELVDTNDSAFWKATRDQALKRWRFRPATRDGEAVASERVMTVRFRLADL
ncbi:MAG: energy transducer TonB [Sphingomonadaceae bacterium]